MSTLLTVELPDELARRARALAAASNQRIEDAVLEWIGRAVDEPQVESLPDGEVLALCDAQLNAQQQEQLSEWLDQLREGNLSDSDRVRLDQLMDVYRRGMVVKARAIKEAVTRGLRPPLDQWVDDAA